MHINDWPEYPRKSCNFNRITVYLSYDKKFQSFQFLAMQRIVLGQVELVQANANGIAVEIINTIFHQTHNGLSSLASLGFQNQFSPSQTLTINFG